MPVPEATAALLSASPRASDISDDFFGEVLTKLAARGVYFDYINPQFYNDDAEKNIPNKVNASNGTVQYGKEVASMLKKIHDLNIIGPNTSFDIGVLAQTNSGKADTGGASGMGNPGLPKELVKNLWQQLQTNKDIQDTGIKITGLMCWAANLDLDPSTSTGGNIRTKKATKNVVPYNWPADLF